MGTDWVGWHEQYDDPTSSMPHRLAAVRARLSDALDTVESQRPGILSLCAGDGRDVIPVLAHASNGKSSRATLVESSPVLAERARASAAAARLDVSVRIADAGHPTNYAAQLPADILMLCGIFGNVSDGDIRRTIASSGGLVTRGGWLIWTRHRRAPDLTPKIRQWFRAAGFDEIAFDSPGAEAWSVGTCVNAGAEASHPLPRLFTFTH